MDWQKHKRDWPNAAHSSFVRSAPHEWHVQSAGTGRTILMLHGAGASTHSFAAIFSALSETNHVIALDLPGQGFTKLGNRNRCGLRPMAEDIAKLLIKLDAKPDLIIGHSAGAAIALTLAADLDPQPQVISINGALENFGGLAGVLFPIFAKMLALNPATGHLFSLFTANETRIKKLISSTGSDVSPEQLRRYQTLVSDSGHVNATLSMMAQWSLEELPETLRKITRPVHFLVGLRDAAVPPSASRRAAERLNDTRVTEIAELGHLMHEEDPDRIMAEIAQNCGLVLQV